MPRISLANATDIVGICREWFLSSTKTGKTALCQRQGLRALCHLWFEDLCEALPLTALNPQMADSPSSNLGADTKKTFKTGWRGKIHRKVDFLKLDIALHRASLFSRFSLL
jgi:hypothetical protein